MNNFTKVSCPKCGAVEGLLCKTATGHSVGASYPHIDRVRAFAAKQRAVSPVNKGHNIYASNSGVATFERIGRVAVRGF